MTSPFDFFRNAQDMQKELPYHAADDAVQNRIRAPVFIDDAVASALKVTYVVGLRICATPLMHDTLFVDAYTHIKGLAAELRAARDARSPSLIMIPLILQIFDGLSDMGYLAADEKNPHFGSMSYKLWALGNHMANNVEIIPYSTS